MKLDQVLELDSAIGAEIVQALDAIATQLALLGKKYPNTCYYLCNEGRQGSDFTLVDAASAVADAAAHVSEYGE